MTRVVVILAASTLPTTAQSEITGLPTSRQAVLNTCVGRFQRNRNAELKDGVSTNRNVLFLGSGSFLSVTTPAEITVRVADSTFQVTVQTEVTGLPTSRSAVLNSGNPGRFVRHKNGVINGYVIGSQQPRRIINIDSPFSVSHFGGILNVPIMV